MSERKETLRETIYRLDGEGHRVAEIARLAGCAQRTVYQALAARGEDASRRGGRSAAPTEAAAVAGAGGAPPAAAPSADLYRGIGLEAYEVAAAADQGSLAAEIVLLRALIRATSREIAGMGRSDRARARTVREAIGLLEVLARIFRASPGADGDPLKALGEAAELVLGGYGGGRPGVAGPG